MITRSVAEQCLLQKKIDRSLGSVREDHKIRIEHNREKNVTSHNDGQWEDNAPDGVWNLPFHRDDWKHHSDHAT